jgi:hypothetical protein
MTLYRILLSEVEEMSARLSSCYARHLVCRPGCDSCCRQDLTVFQVEAEAIRANIRDLPPDARGMLEHQARDVRRRERLGEPVSCPMLSGGNCAIYDSRPIICRTQGLPLLYLAEDGRLEVDFCPLNFTASDSLNDLEEDHLVPLDDLNGKLVEANIEHCGRNAGPTASGARVSMSEIILSCDSGTSLQ